MTIYQRTSGGHVAESLRPLAGSPEAVELEQLAADPESGWRALAEKPLAPAGPPAKTAVKADWVTWAVSQGAEQDDAEKATKDDLIATYGGDDGGSDE